MADISKYIQKYIRELKSLKNELSMWQNINNITPEIQKEIDNLEAKILFWKKNFEVNGIEIK